MHYTILGVVFFLLVHGAIIRHPLRQKDEEIRREIIFLSQRVEKLENESALKDTVSIKLEEKHGKRPYNVGRENVLPDD